MDCYSVLGVDADASQEEIKEAYRRRVLECHPDRAEEGREAVAKEEFLRVKEAFEILSNPGKRTSYDRSRKEGASAAQATEASGRRRSYKEQWRSYREKENIFVSQVILDQVNGLSADYEVIENRTSVTVPLCGFLGALLYLLEPGAIYASNVFLVDLFLCGSIGAIYGYLIGNVWGYADLYLRGSRDR